MALSNFPPPYSLRISKKAQRISLRIRPSIGLEIILPQKVSGTNPLDILKKFQPWIERHYPRIMKQCSKYKDIQQRHQPKSFFLFGGKVYVILNNKEKKILSSLSHENTSEKNKENTESFIDKDILNCSRGEKKISRHHFIEMYPQAMQLPFSSSSGDITLLHLKIPSKLYLEQEISESMNKKITLYIKECLKQLAQKYITPMVEEESYKHSLPYNKLTFRFQKTRWGSCSSKKNINLNTSLIFLPEHLIRYIILHELSHTIEMNHSEHYWKILFSLDEKALKHDKAMRSAYKYTPHWFLANL